MYRLNSVFRSVLFCGMIARSKIKTAKSYMNDGGLK